MNLYLVIDTRDNDIMWHGSRKDCKDWLNHADPLNRPYYVIERAFCETKEELEK